MVAATSLGTKQAAERGSVDGSSVVNGRSGSARSLDNPLEHAVSYRHTEGPGQQEDAMRSIHGSEPVQSMPMLNSARVRDSHGVDTSQDSDGFWAYGYGNSPVRRRVLRRQERRELRTQLALTD